jgi:SAM-dependent methyltransferase
MHAYGRHATQTGFRRDEQVYSRLVQRFGSARPHPFIRLLTEPAYAVRVLRYLLGLPTPLDTTDRKVLEGVIFDYYLSSPQLRSVLFVGCDWYTKHYERTYFRSKSYWTIDPSVSARKFGSKRHVVAPLEELGCHFPAGYFDLIICNGVYGYGLDSREQCERAFDQCYRSLRSGGHLVLGWDDIPQSTPVPLEELGSLLRFDRFTFPAFESWRYTTDTPYRHTYDFYSRALIDDA